MQYGYDSIAKIYDQFNQGFDYGSYFAKIKEALAGFENPFGNRVALDCGCGTGTLMELLVQEGFDCTGVDISTEMLQLAQQKPLLRDVRLICQDLAQIDLYRAYDLVICSLDTVNHLTDKKDLSAFFGKVYNFVEENGFFVFDIKKEKTFAEAEGISVFRENNSVLIFENESDPPFFGQTLTAFREQPDGTFVKHESFVEERFYSPSEITQMMNKTPFLRVAKLSYKERILYIYRKVLSNKNTL